MPGIGWGRAVEESISSHPGVAEVAVVGVKDALKGQVAVAFVIPKESDSLEDRDVALRKRRRLWRWWTARLATLAARRTSGLSQLPKTRSGKMLRRTIQAICEGRDPGDLTTMMILRRWIRSARRWKSRLLSDASRGASGTVCRCLMRR
ncbi:AMP-binding enzyme [Escherichia coli]